MTFLILSAPVRIVGPGRGGLGIVEEVTVISKRDQHLLDRDLQEAGKVLVVALDAGDDDPAMLLMRGRRLRQAKRSAEREIRTDGLRHGCELAMELAIRLPQGAAGMKPGLLLRTAQEG